MLNQRLTAILQLVNTKYQIAVTELAAVLNVSVVTIRKDLTTLEQQGLLRRQHGWAVQDAPDDLNARLAINYAIKVKIAMVTADRVADGATIMLDSGSTCALLADQLGEQQKNVTIVTNSYYIAHRVGDYPTLTVEVLGGQYQPVAQVGVGPLTLHMLTAFHVHQLFVGTDGFDPQSGFSGRNLARNQVIQAMARQADTVTLLTDSSKFQGPSLIQQFPLDQVDAVVTDQDLPSAIATMLRGALDLQLV